MTHKTTASIYTGGALAEVGAKAAGVVPLWKIEDKYDKEKIEKYFAR